MIKRLVLRNTRPFKEAVFDFPPKLSLLFGPNGLGKTTALEAIYVLGTLRSFRTARLFDLVKQESEEAIIEAKFDFPQHKRRIDIRQRSKTLYRDGLKTSDLQGFFKDIYMCALAPDHIKMIKGSPEERRRYLDFILFGLNPAFLENARRYQRALKQKTAILKQGLQKSTYMDLVYPWEKEIIEQGEFIRKKRKELTKNIEDKFSEHYETLSQDSEHRWAKITYQDSGKTLEEEIQEKRDSEFFAQRILVGCHRDDLQIQLNQKIAKDTASQGEISSLLLAFKMTEIYSLEQTHETSPMLLLDDVGGTLDKNRRTKLFDWIQQKNTQVMMTTADPHLMELSKDMGGLQVEAQITV